MLNSCFFLNSDDSSTEFEDDNQPTQSDVTKKEMKDLKKAFKEYEKKIDWYEAN